MWIKCINFSVHSQLSAWTNTCLWQAVYLGNIFFFSLCRMLHSTFFLPTLKHDCLPPASFYLSEERKETREAFYMKKMQAFWMLSLYETCSVPEEKLKCFHNIFQCRSAKTRRPQTLTSYYRPLSPQSQGSLSSIQYVSLTRPNKHKVTVRSFVRLPLTQSLDLFYRRDSLNDSPRQTFILIK